MKFFKSKTATSSRRNSRLFRQQALRTGLGLGVLALVIAGAVYFERSGARADAGQWLSDKTVALTAASGFRVSQILVTGRNRTSQDALLARIDIEQGTPLFAIDLDDTHARIESVPWVKTARISRRLPDTVEITITERTPVALWQHNKKVVAIDADGVTLTDDNLAEFSHLPMIVGAQAPRFVTELAGLLQAEPFIAQNLDSARRIGDRRWDLLLKNGMTVRLPERDAEFALRRLVRTLQTQGLLDKDITAIDLRLADRITVETARGASAKATSDKS